MIQATRSIATQWILDLCNGIVKEGCISEDWMSSVVLSIYKGNTHNTQPFYNSVDFVWDNPGEPVPEETFTR